MNKLTFSERARNMRLAAERADKMGRPAWAIHCRARAIQLENLAKLDKLGRVHA
jgi:hypothetical protein